MDNIGVELAREVAERAVEKNNSDRSFAMDLLSEFKKSNKRMFVIILVLIGMLVGTNMAWLYVFQSYDYTSYEYQQDGEGYNNINHGIEGNVTNNNGAENQDKGTN